MTPSGKTDSSAAPAGEGEPMMAPLAGNIWKIIAKPGQQVEEGEVLLILEAMKMETEIRAPKAGVLQSMDVSEGDAVQVGDQLLSIA
jgi:oxaloacetate decarboxylase alpha subunit